MYYSKFLVMFVIFVGTALFLVGCGQVDEEVLVAEVPATNTPLSLTKTTIPPTQTPLPPTETPVPPTETPIPEPTEELVETQVLDLADMVGTWLPEKFGAYEMIIKDGMGYIKQAGVAVDSGQAIIEDGVYSISSDTCTKVDASGTNIILYTCWGKYKVFLTKSGNTPHHLRFEFIEDENNMRKGLLTQNWMYDITKVDATEDLIEEPVTSCDQLVGTWLPEKFGNSIIIYKPDCFVLLTDTSGEIYDAGEVVFDGDIISVTSDYCTKPNASGTGIITYTCTGVYRMFLTKQGDTPVSIRYELIEDPNSLRVGMATGQNWLYSGE